MKREIASDAPDPRGGSPSSPNVEKQTTANESVPSVDQETLALEADPTKRDSRGASPNQAADTPSSTPPTQGLDPATVQLTGHASSEPPTAIVTPSSQDGEFSVDVKTFEFSPRGKAPGTTVPSSPSRKSLPPVPKNVGSYSVERVLGRGGMGVVYLAHHAGLNRKVALKMVLAGTHASPQHLERFKAEARAVAQLQHPNIVQVFEVGEQDHLPFFSLEYVEGQSLDAMAHGKPLAPEEAARLMEKVCRAMQYAHDRGVLHRDLKPSNILINPQGDPKISDFGLAKQLDDESSNTRTGTIMGTPSYMSPEQARGLVSEVNALSDQYSLGAVLYELLTGRPPFLGTKAFDTIYQVVECEPVPPHQLLAKLPPDLDTICLKALQKSPAKRYASCAEMADDLRRFLHGEPILARPVGLLERASRWCRRNPKIAIPTAIAATMVVATAGVSTWAWSATAMQAAIIADERDNAEEQRDEANRQRAIALENEEKAKEAERVAQLQKEEAEKQRVLAEEAKLQAEKNQLLAEKQAMLALKNIQFVVTDIDDRLAKEPGMASLRIDLLGILENRWNEVDLALAGGIQGQAIPTLMTVRAKIADAWFSLDQLQNANAGYEKLHQLGHDRLIVKNRSDASRYNLAQLAIRWAPIRQRLSGDPAESMKLVDESSELLREILRDPRPEPGSPQRFQIVDVLQQCLTRSAGAHIKAGELEDARKDFEESLHWNESILTDITNAAEWYQSLADDQKLLIKNYFEQNRDLAMTGRANVLCRTGRVDEALPIFEQSIARRRANVEQNPSDRAARDQLALQLRNYGQYMMRVGRLDDAVRLLGQSHDAAEKNYLEDPTSASFKRSFGFSQYYLGAARDVAGQKEDAAAMLERARVLWQSMVDTSPDTANQVSLLLAESRLGNRASAETLIASLSASKAKDPDLRLDLARARAQLSRFTEDSEIRNKDIEECVQHLNQAVADGLKDPFSISNEPDLLPVHDRPAVQELLQKMRPPQ